MDVENFRSEEELKEAITRLKKEKKAVILAHYYQQGPIQDIADHIGDSLALARYAATLDVRRTLHGRNGQIALPRQKGAGTRCRCRLLAGRQLPGR